MYIEIYYFGSEMNFIFVFCPQNINELFKLILPVAWEEVRGSHMNLKEIVPNQCEN
jgi:hypothetical protein